ncbi:MAG: sugar ABC transporter substrate-binding protein, partial [Spirochaetaceae bacterium]|nr:sugar ABC transporter substrate-binding protein [Spirochaetaceae bacterium]
RLEGVLTAGIDGTPGARDSIKKGELTMSVVQDAKGQASKGAEVSKMMVGGEGGGQRYIIPFYPIDASNPDD